MKLAYLSLAYNVRALVDVWTQLEQSGVLTLVFWVALCQSEIWCKFGRDIHGKARLQKTSPARWSLTPRHSSPVIGHSKILAAANDSHSAGGDRTSNPTRGSCAFHHLRNPVQMPCLTLLSVSTSLPCLAC